MSFEEILSGLKIERYDDFLQLKSNETNIDTILDEKEVLRIIELLQDVQSDFLSIYLMIKNVS